MSVDKREFEALRGEPIAENSVAPEDVPCIETSDPGRLCSAPLVSVYMITYNHARYVRQAIEGVMAQRTDFAYELVVGEDCSTDETREICLDFQKRHPDRIRVLWWHENVSALGGNGNRVLARCRGEYVAMCEGDDYWTDPHKLQKQVDLMRAHPSAGECFGGVDFLSEVTGRVERYDCARAPAEFMSGREFAWRMLFGRGSGGLYLQNLHYSAYMARRDVLLAARERFPDIWSWRLRLGDHIKFLSVAAQSDVCFLREPVSVYRRNAFGVTGGNEGRLMRDGDLCKVYFAMAVFGLSFGEAVATFADRIVMHWIKSALRETADGQRAMGACILRSPVLQGLFARARCRAYLTAICKGRLTRRAYRLYRPWFSLVSHVFGRRRPRIEESRT